MNEIKVIQCNYAVGTSAISAGSRAYVIPQLGGNLPGRVRVIVRSRSGRFIEKWENTRRLTNFRLKTIVPEHPMFKRLEHCTAGVAELERLTL